MRIRTIKPAFWKNETLSGLAKADRLLAVALLNYADDEGYFQAHESLVRGECFPFDEDSAEIRRGLAELSRIGFLALGTASDGQRIGRIVTFLEHQKIDKPSKSKFSALTISWDCASPDSASPPRIVAEDSVLEVEVGSGSRKGKAPAALVIPPWVPEEQWIAFVEMRKKIRAPLTNHGMALALRELERLRDAGNDPAAVLNQSVMSSYKGLFELKAKSSPAKPVWEGAK